MGFQDLRHGIKLEKDDVDELNRIENIDLYPDGPEDRPIVEHTKLKMEFKVMVCPKCGTPIQAGWTIPRGQWGKVSALFCPNGCWWKERTP